MQTAASLKPICCVLALLLPACQSAKVSYSYINQSKRTVTVVEHRRNGEQRFTFTPGAWQRPGREDSLPERVEFLDPNRGQIAVYTRGDYEREGDPNIPPVLVVSRSGVALASGAVWRKIAQEWDGPPPAKPVSYGGGNGSSIEQAITVHAQVALDDTLGVYAYIRKRFGYLWTFRSMERGVVGGADGIYDRYEFVTHSGKKHVLFFKNRKWSEAE